MALSRIFGPGLRSAALITLAAVIAAGSGTAMASGTGLARVAVARVTPAGAAGPVPDMPKLRAVSCAAASMCMTVGSAAAIWDGRTWRWLSQPPELPDSEFDAVSCPSATRCVVVGHGGHTCAGLGGRWDA